MEELKPFGIELACTDINTRDVVTKPSYARGEATLGGHANDGDRGGCEPRRFNSELTEHDDQVDPLGDEFAD